MRAVPITPRQVMFTVHGQCPSLHAEGLKEMHQQLSHRSQVSDSLLLKSLSVLLTHWTLRDLIINFSIICASRQTVNTSLPLISIFVVFLLSYNKIKRSGTGAT